MRTSNLHYQACFSIRHFKQPDQTWRLLVKTIRNWVQERVGHPDELKDPWFFSFGKWTSPRNKYVYVQTNKADSHGNEFMPEYWALRMQIQDSGFEARYWRTDIGIVTRNGDDPLVAITVSNYIKPGYIGPEPMPASFSCPKLVHKLMNPTWVPHAGSLPLTLRHYTYAEADIPNILELLGSRDRTCPIVILARRGTHGDPLVAPEGLTTKVAGAAAVFLSRDGNAETALIESLPFRFRVLDGMARIYMPGVNFDDESDAGRHRYYSRSHIEEVGPSQVAVEIIRALTRRLDLTRHDAVFDIDDVYERYRRQRINALRKQALSGQPGARGGNTPPSAGTDQSEWIALLERENEDLSRSNRDLIEDLLEEQEARQRAESLARLHLDRALDAERALSEKSSAEATLREFSTLPSSVEECLLRIAGIYRDRVMITDRAIDSAKKAVINRESAEIPQVWSLLWSIPNTLHAMIFEHELDKASLVREFREETGFELSLTEGKQTRDDRKLMALRQITWGGKEMSIEPHVKYGNRPPRCLRVHFAIDRENKCLVIGHCGDHLDNYSTRKRK